MTQRLDRLTALFDSAKIDGLLLTNHVNVHYLVGFGEDSFLLVSKGKSYLVTDSRYTEDAGKKVKDAEVYTWSKNLFAEIAQLASDLGIKHLGFEAEQVSVASHAKMRSEFTKCDLIPTTGLTEKLRLIKTPDEIEEIKSATIIADTALLNTIELLKPGVSEREIAVELAYRMTKAGAQKESFPAIVAFDENASLPHAVPSGKKLTENSLIQFDWGAQYNHYCSDCSRVIFIGDVQEEVKKIYQIVIDANQKAKDGLKPGVTLMNVDALARNHINECGYGNFFGHGLGHGVGLQVHESPRLNPKSEAVAKEGMIVTIEAGIYLPGIGGIRVEDLVAVTSTGIEILTKLPREPKALL